MAGLLTGQIYTSYEPARILRSLTDDLIQGGLLVLCVVARRM